MSLLNFAEPNFRNDPGPGPSAGSFTPWPRRIAAAVTAAEPGWRHLMSAENSGHQLLRGRSDGLLGVLQPVGGDHVPGRVDH
jgi:hypothetical protein